MPSYLHFYCSEMKDDELLSSANSNEVSSTPSLSLERKQFSGRYAIASDEFTNELVSFIVYTTNISYFVILFHVLYPFEVLGTIFLLKIHL